MHQDTPYPRLRHRLRTPGPLTGPRTGPLAFSLFTGMLTGLLAGCTGAGGNDVGGGVSVSAPGASAPSVNAKLCPSALLQSATTPLLVPTATSAEPAPGLPPGVRADLARLGDSDVATCVAVVTPQGDLLGLPLTPRRPSGAVEHVAARRARLLEDNLDAVAATLSAQAATAPGLDVVGALRTAIRLHPTPTTMVVITSGVATADPVDLRRLGWDPDAVATARAAAAQGWLPDLTGWRIRFAGLGDVADGRPALPPPLQQRLVALWLAVARAAGATSCTSDGGLPTRTPTRSTNTVPPVPFPQLISPVVAARPDGTSTTWRLPASLLFAVDSADLATGTDPDLLRLVRAAQASGGTVTVVGHTDAVTGTAAYNDALSLARARAVAERLQQLGLDPRRIVGVTGRGSRDASARTETADPSQVGTDRNVVVTVTARGGPPSDALT